MATVAVISKSRWLKFYEHLYGKILGLGNKLVLSELQKRMKYKLGERNLRENSEQLGIKEEISRGSKYRTVRTKYLIGKKQKNK